MASATSGTRPSPVDPPQRAPLTPEYQAIYEANLADQKTGGQGTDPLFRAAFRPACRGKMTVVFPMEIIIMPGITYMAFETRATYSAASTPTAATGRRIRSHRSRAIRSASGRTLTATAATICSRSRPAASVARAPMSRSGIPLHADNQTIVKERF